MGKGLSFKKIKKGLGKVSGIGVISEVTSSYDLESGFKHLTDQVNSLISKTNSPSSRGDADTYKGEHGDIKINKIGPNRYEFYIRGEDGWHKDNNASFGPLGNINALNDPPVINMTSGQIDYGYQGNDRLTLNLDPTKISTASVATPSVKAWGNLKLESTGHVILSPTNNVGIGTTSPTTTLDVEGTVSYKHTAFTTAGPTDNVDVSGTTVLEVNTVSNNVTIGGFTGGVQGQVIYIVKTSTNNFIQLEHAELSVNQDIYLTSGADERVVGFGGWTLYCNGSNWFSLSNPTGAADAG